MLRGLDADCVDSCGFSVPPHLVKEHSFAHAAQTYQHHALCRPAQAKPIEAMLTSFRMMLRPASSGGGLPAPGA